MNQLLNFLGGNIQLLVFLAVIFFSIMGTVAKKLQEKQEQRRVAMDARRREMERLRTGRVDAGEGEPEPPDAEAERQRRLEELAERRRRQLDELRKRRAAAGGTAPTGAQAPTTAPPRPTPRPAQRPTPTQPAPSRQQAPRPVPVPQRPAPRPQPVPTASPVPAPRRRTPSAPVPGSGPRATAGPAPRATTAPIGERGTEGARTGAHPPASGSLALLRDMSRDELRRAIVLSEILAPPVSERPMSA